MSNAGSKGVANGEYLKQKATKNSQTAQAKIILFELTEQGAGRLADDTLDAKRFRRPLRTLKPFCNSGVTTIRH